MKVSTFPSSECCMDIRFLPFCLHAVLKLLGHYREEGFYLSVYSMCSHIALPVLSFVAEKVNR